MSTDIGGKITDDPATDDRIVRYNQNGNDGIDPSTKLQLAALAKCSESADRALFGHAAQRGFCHDHGVTKSNGQHNVHQQKNTAAIFCGQIRETPDVAKTYRCACSRQHKADLTGKGAPFGML